MAGCWSSADPLSSSIGRLCRSVGSSGERQILVKGDMIRPGARDFILRRVGVDVVGIALVVKIVRAHEMIVPMTFRLPNHGSNSGTPTAAGLSGVLCARPVIVIR